MIFWKTRSFPFQARPIFRGELLPPRKLTWNLKMMVSNRNLLFQGFIFRFHVSFRGVNFQGVSHTALLLTGKALSRFSAKSADGKVLPGWDFCSENTVEKANVASRFSRSWCKKILDICSLSLKSRAICKSIFLPRVLELELKVSIDQHQSAYKYFQSSAFYEKKNTQTHIPYGPCLNNVGSTFRPQRPDMPQVTPCFSLCLCFRRARGA